MKFSGRDNGMDILKCQWCEHTMYSVMNSVRIPDVKCSQCKRTGYRDEAANKA